MDNERACAYGMLLKVASTVSPENERTILGMSRVEFPEARIPTEHFADEVCKTLGMVGWPESEAAGRMAERILKASPRALHNVAMSGISPKTFRKAWEATGGEMAEGVSALLKAINSNTLLRDSANKERRVNLSSSLERILPMAGEIRCWAHVGKNGGVSFSEALLGMVNARIYSAMKSGCGNKTSWDMNLGYTHDVMEGVVVTPLSLGVQAILERECLAAAARGDAAAASELATLGVVACDIGTMERMGLAAKGVGGGVREQLLVAMMSIGNEATRVRACMAARLAGSGGVLFRTITSKLSTSSSSKDELFFLFEAGGVAAGMAKMGDLIDGTPKKPAFIVFSLLALRAEKDKSRMAAAMSVVEAAVRSGVRMDTLANDGNPISKHMEGKIYSKMATMTERAILDAETHSSGRSLSQSRRM